MVEPVLFGLISTGVAKASGYTAREIWEEWRESRFEYDFHEPTDRFTARLRRELTDVAERRGLDELIDLVEAEDWDAIIDAFDEEEVLTASNQEAAVDGVVSAIARSTDLDLTDGEHEELRRGVATAYVDALDHFVDAIVGTDLWERWEFERQRTMQRQLEEVLDEVERVARQGALQAYDFLPANEEGFETAASGLDPPEIEFIDRPELEGQPKSRKVLLHGPGGSGKSRALMELLDRFSETDHGFEHIVRPREPFGDKDQIRTLENEPFRGDVLLLWDDVQAFERDIVDHQVFERTVHRLENALDRADYELHVLAATRSEGLDDVQHSGSRFWDDFELVSLEEYQEVFLRELVDRAMEEFGVGGDTEARDVLTAVAADVNPSPFYVTSVIEVASRRGGELTENLVAELPEDVGELWIEERDWLAENHEDAYEILRAIKLLSLFDIPFNAGLVRGVAREVFECPRFGPRARTLVEMRWISVAGDASPTDKDARYTIHDLKLLVVEIEGAEFDERVESFSKFMLGGLENHVPDDGESLRQTAHDEFAFTMGHRSKEGFRNYAEPHYNHIFEEIQPDDIGYLHSNYGVLLTKEGKLEKAANQFEEAIEADPDNAKTFSNYGNLLERQGRYQKAEAKYEAAIDADPDNAVIYLNFGDLLEDQGRYQEAEAAYEAAIDTDPNLAVAHYNYAMLLHGQDRYEEAEVAYKAAIEADPDYADAHSNYGLLLEEQNRYTEAKAAYEAAIEVDPEFAGAYYNYAVLLHKQDHPQPAAEHYEQAIAARDDFVEAHGNYGNLLKEQGLDNEALTQYRAIIEANPYDAKAHYHSATLLHDRNELENARKHFKKSVELWRQQGNINDALHSLRLLVSVNEDIDDTTTAIDNCIFALELANMAGDDFDEHLQWFGSRCLEHIEGGVPADIETTYDWTLRTLVCTVFPVAPLLIQSLWERRNETDDESDEFRIALAAGVGYASLPKALPSELQDQYEAEIDTTDMLSKLTPHHNLLPPSPKSLFSLLTTFDPDVDPVPDNEDDAGEPLHEDEDAAFTRLTTLVNQSL